MTTTMRVLTYNTHLCGFSGMSFFGEGGEIVGKGRGKAQPMTYLDSRRLRLICERIEALDPDLVALQEVWDHESFLTKITQRLGTKYPFSYVPTDLNTKESGKEVPGYVPRLPFVKQTIRILSVGSGLMLFSKYPLADAKLQPYPEPQVHGDDKRALKGVLSATVTTPEGPVRIGLTHAGTDTGGEGLPNIQHLIHCTMSPRSMPAVMVGDLNVNWVKGKQPGSDYAEMDAVLEKAGAHDAYRSTHGESSEAVQHYLDELDALVTEHRKELETLKATYDPRLEPVGRKRDAAFIGILVKIRFITYPVAHWYYPDVPPQVDLQPFNRLRTSLVDLATKYGITANDPTNLLNAYFGPAFRS